jgi:hypothetical protein
MTCIPLSDCKKLLQSERLCQNAAGDQSPLPQRATGESIFASARIPHTGEHMVPLPSPGSLADRSSKRHENRKHVQKAE